MPVRRGPSGRSCLCVHSGHWSIFEIVMEPSRLHEGATGAHELRAIGVTLSTERASTLRRRSITVETEPCLAAFDALAIGHRSRGVAAVLPDARHEIATESATISRSSNRHWQAQSAAPLLRRRSGL